jgi:hypothetical protein
MGQPGAVPESACDPRGAVVAVDFAGVAALSVSLHEAMVEMITTAAASRTVRDRREAGVMANSRSRRTVL